MPSLSALLAAVLLGLTATLFAACGGEEERTGLLAQSRAAQIKDGLADVEEAVADGSCTRVGEELGGLRTQLDQLPRNTDAELRDRLVEGVSHLEDIAPIECEGDDTETMPETTPETIPETVPPEPVPEEPPAETTPPPVTTQPPGGEDGQEGGAGDEGTPGNGNGNGPPGGVPPGQVPDSGGAEAPGDR